MDSDFAVRVHVRSYEVDVNGHVNHANYHRYGEHARTEHLTAAGCSIDRLTELGVGIVLLETHVRFLRELRHGDAVDISSDLAFGEGKTFTIEHVLRKADGVVAAEISCRMGLLDAAARKLLPEPRARFAEMATEPAVLGIG